MDWEELATINFYPEGFVRPVEMKDAVSGDWKLQNFEVDEEKIGLMNFRTLRDNRPHRIVTTGEYTRLTRNNTVVMSDTHAEAWEHQEALFAKGNVLIAGLGIGFVLGTLAYKEDVSSIMVIEKSEDVIKMVAPYYEHLDNVTIVQGDIFKFKIPDWIDFCWFDIWDDICFDNYEEMQVLHQKARDISADSAAWSERDLLSEYNEIKLDEMGICRVTALDMIEERLSMVGLYFSYISMSFQPRYKWLEKVVELHAQGQLKVADGG